MKQAKDRAFPNMADSASHAHQGASLETTKWHWVVCFAVPFATILEAALPHSFGTMIAHFQKTTQLPMIELIFITAITSAAPLLLLPVVVPLIRRFNRYHRQIAFCAFLSITFSSFLSSAVSVIHLLFFTYTFIYSLASSVLLAVCIVILSEYFPVNHPHHILATSLYQIGYPVAAASFSPFLAFLISKYNWQRGLQVIGGIQLVLGCSTTLLFKPLDKNTEIEEDMDTEDSQAEEDNRNEEKGGKKCQSMCCSKREFSSRPQMVPWFLAKYLNYTCWFAMRTSLTPFLRYRKYSLTDASFIMTSYALGEITLCVTGAFLSRYLRGRLLCLHFIGSLGMASFLLLWVFLPLNYALELFIAIFIGAFVQVTLSYGYPASAELLGLEMGRAWTITNIFAGLGVLSSPLLGGLTVDNTSSFLVFFYISIGLWMMQVILHGVTWLIIRFRSTASPYDEIR